MGLLLEDYSPRIRFTPTRSHLRAILRDVLASHNMDEATIRAKSRLRPIVRARQEFMYLAHKIHGYSLPHVGQFLGGMDHTTVLHGCRAHARRLALN